MSQQDVQADRDSLVAAQQKGLGATLAVYMRLSGPGWIASAITLGGGSLASSLYLGVLGGYSLMWLQPFAMILGVIMLSAIGYVTLSTGERPFRAINEHVSPVLGWSWALAVALANVIWCMPQFALADGVLTQNLLPGLLGPDGGLALWSQSTFGDDYPWLAANFGKLAVAAGLLFICTMITWRYDKGGFGLRLYETVLKLVVAMIVLCFFGVVLQLTFSSDPLDWGQILRGFVPDFRQFWNPTATFLPFLDAIGPAGNEIREFWSDNIVDGQRDVMISAVATAVGINMTLMFPYAMLRKGWTREFRGLAIFDLSTGMFIPYVLATGCVVIASAARFHTEIPMGFSVDEKGALTVPLDGPKLNSYKGLLAKRSEALADAGEPSNAEKRLAAMLIKRDSMDLSQSLVPLTGPVIANIVFGLGVLAMVLSTISILMLISGFVFAEMMNYPPGGVAHRLGTLVAGFGGMMWPLFWAGDSKFYLAVVTSVFGFMLLPFAYVTFVLLLNSKSLLGDELPTGFSRFLWNLLVGIAAIASSVGAGYMIWLKSGYLGVAAVAMFLALTVMVAINQRNEARARRDA